MIAGAGAALRPEPCPDVSVSIVTYDSAAWLPALRDALAAQQGVAFETFVVDNDSRDATRDHLARWRDGDVTLNPGNVGFGRAHNQNLARFRGRYVLFLNPDVRFGADLLARLVGYLDERPEVAIAGPMVLEGETGSPFPPRRFYPGEGMVPLAPGLARREIAWLNGCCLAVRRDVLVALGGFDADYFLYQEETDLCLRARRDGHRLGCCEAAVVHHLKSESQRGMEAFGRSLRLFRGTATFWDKHYREADVRRMVKFQYWVCRLLLAAGPALDAVAGSRPQLAPPHIRARLAVCREWMAARGMHPGELRHVPVRIALRQAAIAGHWIARGRFPLDDY